MAASMKAFHPNVFRALACIILAITSSLYSPETGQAQSCLTLGAAGIYWIWTPLYVHNLSSIDSTSLSSAMSDWSSDTNFQLNAYGSFGNYYTDITVRDATGNPDYAGVAYLVSQGSSGCSGYQDPCGNCMNNSVMYYVNVYLNQTSISSLASSHGKTVAVVPRTVMAHELGHSLGLTDSPDHYDCDSTLSIMNPTIDFSISCGLIGPTSCDSSDFYTIYAGRDPASYCGVCDGSTHCH